MRPRPSPLVRWAAPSALMLATLLLGSCDDSGDDTGSQTEADEQADSDPEQDSSPGGEATAPADLNVGDISPGDCIESVAAELISEGTVTVVPCDQPHEAEAFHEADWDAEAETEDGTGGESESTSSTGPDTGPPGFDADAMAAWAEGICIDKFADYTGVPYDDSDLEVTWLMPDADSFAAGDREIDCLLTGADPSVPLTAGRKAP